MYIFESQPSSSLSEAYFYRMRPCGLGTSLCGLNMRPCGLSMSPCGLNTSPCGPNMSPYGLIPISVLNHTLSD